MGEKYLLLDEFKNGTGSYTFGKDNDGEYLEVGEYLLRMDYESSSTLQACQLARKVIVGYRTTLSATVGRIPYTTSATKNSNITTEEKLNSAGTVKVTVLNKTTGRPVANLPLYAGLGIGDDTNYYSADYVYDDLVSRYNHSKKLSGSFTTNSNGVATINLKVGDFFDASTISQVRGATSIVNGNSTYMHTLYIRVMGTDDRPNNDNYVRNVCATPVFFGTMPISHTNLTVNPVQTEGNVLGNAVAKCCGMGTVRVDFDLYYVYANLLKNNYGIDVTPFYVSKGYLTVEYSSDNTNFTPLGVNYLMPAANGNIHEVNQNGQIIMDNTINKKGFLIKMPVRYDYTGTLYFKILYHENVGDTEPRTLGTLTTQVKPTNPSYTELAVDIALYEEDEPIIMVAGNAKNVKLGVYRKDDGEHTVPLTQGEIEYTTR